MFRKPQIFYGWWVLFACAFLQFYFSITFIYGFTTFFNPIVDEFGWSYAAVSLAITFRGFEIGFLSPAVGFFVDKYRPRKLLLIGVIIGAGGFFFFSRIHSLWSFYAAFILLGLSLSLHSQVVVMAAVATWFNRRTTLAMGFLTAGTGAAGLFVPGLIWIVDNIGWRRSLELSAIGAIAICLPVCFLVKDPPKEAVAIEKNKKLPSSNRATAGTTFRVIIKKKNFWLLSLAAFCVGLSSAAISTHQIPYLVSVGITRGSAGWLVVVLSIAGLTGRLGFGWLGDIIDKRRCFIIASLLQTAGLLAFGFSVSIPQVFSSLIILGLGMGGSIPLRPALQIEFFGLDSFALIQGLLIGLMTLGSMGSPPFAGWVFDSFHSYRLAWIIFSGLSLLAFPLIMLTSKPSRSLEASGTTNITLS